MIHSVMKTVTLISILVIGGSCLHAAPRTSADYAIPSDVIDSGGQHASSAGGIYGNDGSAGQIAGVSSATNAITRAGFVGQLYELVGHALLASDLYPPELGTTQIIPVRTADDGTSVAIATTGISFSILDGPLTSITPGGLVTTGAVAQNTSAHIGATSAAFAGQLSLALHVRDTIPDNFGSYAGDGLDDAWQYQFFGANNPLAAPEADPDHDGFTNLFEYTAGVSPLDAGSVFSFHTDPVPGQPGRMSFIFSPRFADRTYTVRSSPTLPAAAWSDLVNFTVSDDGDTRTITDLDATGAAKFYHVEITKP